MRIAITGASGFIGRHLAARLVDEGHELRALYRRAAPPAELLELQARGAELLHGDLGNPDTIRRLVEGCDAVVHAAALTLDWGRKSLFEEMNFLPAQKLCEAAEAAGVRAFLYISSIAVHGFGNHIDSTEDGPYFRLNNPYPDTKKRAEEYILSRNRADFRTIAVRPGNVAGKGDTTTWYPIFEAVERGFMGWIGSGKALSCPVHVDDLVDACVAALEKSPGGERYNITCGEKVTWKELIEYCYVLLNPKKKALRLAAPFAYVVAAVLGAVFRVFRIKKDPPLSYYRVKQLITNYHFSMEKARRMLDYRPRSTWRAIIERTVKDYLDERKRENGE